MYPEIKDYYDHNEMYYLLKFNELMSANYNFDILYFTKKSLLPDLINNNQNNNIYIKLLPEDVTLTWDNCIKYMSSN